MKLDEIEIPEEIDDLLNRKEKKKRKNSKGKGNRGELKICKILTERFHQEFVKTPDSGGFGTVHNLHKVAKELLTADILCPPNWKWSIENKFGYDLDMINFFSEKSNTDKKLLYDFIDQASRDAVASNRYPMVVYTKDRRPTLAIIPEKDFNSADLLATKISEFTTRLKFKYQPKHLDIWNEWVCVSFESLLKIMPDEFFYFPQISA